tara:strand:- start:371 stop:544 length:174 start_codon:yes stop_codon:yes gene_type:complete
MLRKEVEKMTIEEMRTEIQKLEQELENLKTKEELIKELKLKVMGQICAYEYLIQEAA